MKNTLHRIVQTRHLDRRCNALPCRGLAFLTVRTAVSHALPRAATPHARFTRAPLRAWFYYYTLGGNVVAGRSRLFRSQYYRLRPSPSTQFVQCGVGLHCCIPRYSIYHAYVCTSFYYRNLFCPPPPQPLVHICPTVAGQCRFLLLLPVVPLTWFILYVPLFMRCFCGSGL